MKNSTTILYKNLGTKMQEQSIEFPYIVPKGYFESVSTSVVARLAKEEFVSPSNEISIPAFYVPEGYFKGLSNSILASINGSQNDNVDELASIAPILNSISRKLPYKVNTGYFNNLLNNNAAISLLPTAKIISITNRMIWLKMAVAVSIVGIIVFSATIFFHKNEVDTYASYNNIDLKKSVNKLSDDDLLRYLDNDYIASNSETIILDDGAAPSLEQDAEAVPDDAMNQYLQNVSIQKKHKKGL